MLVIALLDAIKTISEHIVNIEGAVIAMIEERKKANKIEAPRERAIAYCDHVKEKHFDKIRYAVDKLELLVDNNDWPLVKYREMLFIR